MEEKPSWKHPAFPSSDNHSAAATPAGSENDASPFLRSWTYSGPAMRNG
ncbi:Uncharacterised protein [Mycobacteroides abscessus]|nr:Uncharacterised protein [Mycobacteroides abscessus]